MTIADLLKKTGIRALSEIPDPTREIKGGYTGDLLSWVMGRAKPDDVWITIMNNINIVAVATLTDVSAIILCEGVDAPSDVIAKANEEDVVILQTQMPAFEISALLGGEM